MKKIMLVLSLMSTVMAESGYASVKVSPCENGQSWSYRVISCEAAPTLTACDEVVVITPSVTKGNYWTPCTGKVGACVKKTSATCYSPEPIEAPSCSNQTYLVNDCSSIISTSPVPRLSPLRPTDPSQSTSTPTSAQDLCNQSGEHYDTGNSSDTPFVNMKECMWDTTSNACLLNAPAGDGSFVMCSVVRPTPVLQHVATTKSGTLTG